MLRTLRVKLISQSAVEVLSTRPWCTQLLGERERERERKEGRERGERGGERESRI